MLEVCSRAGTSRRRGEPAGRRRARQGDVRADRRLARQGAARGARADAVPVSRRLRVRRVAAPTSRGRRSTPRSSAPPRSTEQILHPEEVRARREAGRGHGGAAAVASRLRDRAAHGVGRARVRDVPARARRSEQIAGEAAAGWGGDRAVVYAKAGDSNPRHAVGLVRLAWDTETDAIEAHDAAVRALDQSTPGGTLENDELATRWLAVDGTVSVVERRGSAVTIGIGIPARVAEAVIGDAWTALRQDASK